MRHSQSQHQKASKVPSPDRCRSHPLCLLLTLRARESGIADPAAASVARPTGSKVPPAAMAVETRATFRLGMV